MDSCLRRIYLQAVEADLDFAERVEFAAEIHGAIYVSELPGLRRFLRASAELGYPRVWVVESGEYEMRGTDAVASSVPAAIAEVKRIYGPPYVVRWEEPVATKRGWEMTAHFEGVVGLSAKHTVVFYIDPHPLAGMWRR